MLCRYSCFCLILLFRPAGLLVSLQNLIKFTVVMPFLCGRQASCWNAKQDREGWLLLNGPRVVNGHTRPLALCLSVSSSRRWLLAVVINVSHRHTLKQNTDKSVHSFRSFRCANTPRQIGCLSLCHLYTQKNTSLCKHTECSHTPEWSLDLYVHCYPSDWYLTALIPAAGWVIDQTHKHTRHWMFSHHFSWQWIIPAMVITMMLMRMMMTIMIKDDGDGNLVIFIHRSF